MSNNTETFKVKIGLSGTYWDRSPKFSVLLNNEKRAEGTITGPSGAIQYIEFDATLTEDTEHDLKIRLDNKTKHDTIVDVDHTTILKDMLLNIESIEIDYVDLGPMLWTVSEFVPDDSNRPTLKNCVNLGWNGAYTIKFTSPFYLWLLENM